MLEATHTLLSFTDLLLVKLLSNLRLFFDLFIGQHLLGLVEYAVILLYYRLQVRVVRRSCLYAAEVFVDFEFVLVDVVLTAAIYWTVLIVCLLIGVTLMLVKPVIRRSFILSGIASGRIFDLVLQPELFHRAEVISLVSVELIFPNLFGGWLRERHIILVKARLLDLLSVKWRMTLIQCRDLIVQVVLGRVMLAHRSRTDMIDITPIFFVLGELVVLFCLNYLTIELGFSLLCLL